MDTIISDYKNGLFWAEIGKKHNCSASKIRRTIRKEGLISRKRIFSSVEEQEICRRYLSNESSLKIAKDFKCSKYAILQILKRNSVDRRTTSEACRIYSINESVFEENTEGSMYWAGFLMADGNLFESKKVSKRIQIGLHNKDREHLEKLNLFLQTDRPLYRENKGTASKLIISSERIFDSLKRFGLKPKKSKTAKASNFAAKNRHFWRGVVDGDGSIYFDKQGPCLSLVGSKSIVQQFRDFVLMHVNTEAKVLTHKTIFEIKLSGEKAIAIIKELYKDCSWFLERKNEKAKRAILGEA
jgi:intein-encoded DNA endonuclease-like protein